MTQEEKQLLLVDLCARLPYGVKVTNGFHTITLKVRIDTAPATLAQFMGSKGLKYYLRPMSSMTEEEFKEVTEIDRKRMIFSARHLTWHIDGEVIDFFNRKMLDWRGLIPMGLALEAPEDMYNTKYND